jgi:hypothetical protein
VIQHTLNIAPSRIAGEIRAAGDAARGREARSSLAICERASRATPLDSAEQRPEGA